MRKIILSKSKQDRVIEHFVARTTARCAADLVGAIFKSTAYYFQRLREIFALETQNNDVLSGEFEVDESYFGWRAPRQTKGKRGRSAAGKVPVLWDLETAASGFTRK